jgi:hypothetical protein
VKLKDIEHLLPAEELKKKSDEIIRADYMPALLLPEEEQKRVGAILGARLGYHRNKERLTKIQTKRPKTTTEYRQQIEVCKEIILDLDEIYKKLLS